jgi:hypothetical protein
MDKSSLTREEVLVICEGIELRMERLAELLLKSRVEYIDFFIEHIIPAINIYKKANELLDQYDNN